MPLPALRRWLFSEKCPLCGRTGPRSQADGFGVCRTCQRAAYEQKWDPRLEGVICEECMLPLSRRTWGWCTREPWECWGNYAIGRYQELDADAEEDGHGQ